MKFSDGVDFTADDVVFTIMRVLDPQTAYAKLSRIAQVQSAVAVDKYTVDVKTKAVFPTLLLGLSEIIMEPKHYYEKVGANAVAVHPVGTGPFIFQEWVPGDHYTLTANKAYWGRRAENREARDPRHPRRRHPASPRSSPARLRSSRKCRSTCWTR